MQHQFIAVVPFVADVIVIAILVICVRGAALAYMGRGTIVFCPGADIGSEISLVSKTVLAVPVFPPS